MNQVVIADALADAIGTNRGTAISDEHVSFLGAYHTACVVEGGKVVVLDNPGGASIPAEFWSKKRLPGGGKAAVDLQRAALAFAAAYKG